MKYTAAELAERLGGEVTGDRGTVLQGFAPADRAQPGDLTFAENPSYLQRAEASAASAILVDVSPPTSSKVLIKVPNARLAYAKALPLFFPEAAPPPGVHPTAVVASSAEIDPSAHVGPLCLIGARARIGPRCILEGQDFVGADCQLGEAVHLFPQVTLYQKTEVGNRVRIHSGTVVGSDGFGYVQDNGAHLKVPQIGTVIIREDVELGANVTVDRGALGPTVIGKGTKVDNLVQIAHNVTLGEHCLIVAQCGIAGSTKLGDYVVMAGQSGVISHVRVGSRVMVGSKAAVLNNVRDGEKVWGIPAVNDRQAKRQAIALQKLPDLIRKVHELEAQLKQLESRADVPASVPEG
jgi:UDP-3-O-[3-hydroxymyristoyl] glucosamine N-acyltransferase